MFMGLALLTSVAVPCGISPPPNWLFWGREYHKGLQGGVGGMDLTPPD